MISHAFPTGPRYETKEAGITRENLDFVGMRSALLEAIQQWKTQLRKLREVLCCCSKVTPDLSHASVTQAKLDQVAASGSGHFPGQNKYDLL